MSAAPELRPSADGHCSIGEYAFIGDTRTGGLCGPDGSIDWMCVPRFDSAPLFGALVGGTEAGRFAIGPMGRGSLRSRRYRPYTATVETEWEVDGATLTLSDGMIADVTGTGLPELVLVRRIGASGRPVDVSVDFDPRFGWTPGAPRTRRIGNAVVVSHGATAVAVTASGSHLIEPGRSNDLTVVPGEPVTIVMTASNGGPAVVVHPDTALAALADDERGWRQWCAGIDIAGPYREAVARSFLTLRLLTFSPSGAPVAAPTTSLPEEIGGIRNWDYRYAWPRDASLGITAFLAADRPEEADRFLRWLLHASRLDRPRLPAMLTLFGTPVPEEHELGWPGYRDSTPVRVGNAAASQRQLDVYGWPLDAAAALSRQTGSLGRGTWRALAAFADYAADNWGRPDAGLWEVRDQPRHFVHSKLMAWVALDRALQLAQTHRIASRRRARWEVERRKLADAIRCCGVDAERGRYRRAFDDDALDAALLLLPSMGFDPDGSATVRRTVEGIAQELSAGGPFLYRYRPGSDGVAGSEGAFLPCSFWLVQALADLGDADRSADLMDQLITVGGPLGLYSEEIDAGTGEQLANYPQALTHAALVNAAYAVSRSG